MLDFDQKLRLCLHIRTALPSRSYAAQSPVRTLSKLMFVVQEPGTAAAMNFAVVSQPSDNLGALTLFLVSSSGLVNAANCLLIAIPTLTTRDIVAPSSLRFPRLCALQRRCVATKAYSAVCSVR
jgi:hypothetical protein